MYRYREKNVGRKLLKMSLHLEQISQAIGMTFEELIDFQDRGISNVLLKPPATFCSPQQSFVQVGVETALSKAHVYCNTARRNKIMHDFLVYAAVTVNVFHAFMHHSTDGAFVYGDHGSSSNSLSEPSCSILTHNTIESQLTRRAARPFLSRS